MGTPGSERAAKHIASGFEKVTVTNPLTRSKEGPTAQLCLGSLPLDLFGAVVVSPRGNIKVVLLYYPLVSPRGRNVALFANGMASSTSRPAMRGVGDAFTRLAAVRAVRLGAGGLKEGS